VVAVGRSGVVGRESSGWEGAFKRQDDPLSNRTVLATLNLPGHGSVEFFPRPSARVTHMYITSDFLGKCQAGPRTGAKESRVSGILGASQRYFIHLLFVFHFLQKSSVTFLSARPFLYTSDGPSFD
jgi:hypothetical protein